MCQNPKCRWSVRGEGSIALILNGYIYNPNSFFKHTFSTPTRFLIAWYGTGIWVPTRSQAFAGRVPTPFLICHRRFLTPFLGGTGHRVNCRCIRPNSITRSVWYWLSFWPSQEMSCTNFPQSLNLPTQEQVAKRSRLRKWRVPNSSHRAPRGDHSNFAFWNTCLPRANNWESPPQPRHKADC